MLPQSKFGYLWSDDRGYLGMATAEHVVYSLPGWQSYYRMVLVDERLRPFPSDVWEHAGPRYVTAKIAKDEAALKAALGGFRNNRENSDTSLEGLLQRQANDTALVEHARRVSRQSVTTGDPPAPGWKVPVSPQSVVETPSAVGGYWRRAVNRPIFWFGAPLLIFGLWTFFGSDNTILMGQTPYLCPPPSEMFLATGWVDVRSVDGDPSRMAYTLCKQAQTPWAVGSVVAILVGAVVTLLSFPLLVAGRHNRS